MDNKNNFHSCGSFIIGLLLLSLFSFIFFVDPRISGGIYLGFVLIAILSGLIVYFSSSIKEFSFKDMRVVLHQAKVVEQGINETALNLVEIMAFQSVYSSGSWLNRKNLNDKMEALLSSAKIDLSKKESILKLPRLMEKFMKDEKSLTAIEGEIVKKVFELTE